MEPSRQSQRQHHLRGIEEIQKHYALKREDQISLRPIKLAMFRRQSMLRKLEHSTPIYRMRDPWEPIQLRERVPFGWKNVLLWFNYLWWKTIFFLFTDNNHWAVLSPMMKGFRGLGKKDSWNHHSLVSAWVAFAAIHSIRKERTRARAVGSDLRRNFQTTGSRKPSMHVSRVVFSFIEEGFSGSWLVLSGKGKSGSMDLRLLREAIDSCEWWINRDLITRGLFHNMLFIFAFSSG